VGAVKLQKIIKTLQSKGALTGLIVSSPDDSMVWVERRTSESESRAEFSFQFRVEKLNNKEVWWPVNYKGANGESISCETVHNGKTLVNFVKQDALIELAESWAKTLEAELVAKTVDNVLR